MIDNFLIHLFHQGNCMEAYKVFGAHLEVENGKRGTRFTVYAPNAVGVCVAGDFNNWNGFSHHLVKITDGGIYSNFFEGIEEGATYKYQIRTKDGRDILKSDPYAFFSEMRPNTASVVCGIDYYPWTDKKWMDAQNKNFDKKLNIYEMHFGSWKLKKEFTKEKDGEFFNYEEMIDQIIPYVKKMGYTHIELMPLAEHPFDGSWGYQPTGYFSATSRYGKPKQLMHFIDACHENGVGVIMDFVPCHFVKDAHGLAEFDGGFVYEYPDINRRFTEWNSLYFDLGREEVRSFMMSSVDFWASYYHVDGIRFDAVSHLIYWKGSKEAGENEGAQSWVKRMTYNMTIKHPGCMLIAEDSSDFPRVTRGSMDGGLGFDYKWDLGWMNDTLKYMSTDPIMRQYMHSKMTFSMAYFYGENYILPFSHDEVVHSKKTILDKIHGTHEEKIAQVKTLYMYMMTHPGKKLNFMGNELAEYKEWDEKKALGWDILKFPVHDSFHRYTRELNEVYNNHPCLYDHDYYPDGYEWMVVDDFRQSVFAYERNSPTGDHLLVVLNFTKNRHTYYTIPVTKYGIYTEVLNTDKDIYSGTNVTNAPKMAKNVPALGKKYSLDVDLPPYSGIIFSVTEKPLETKAAKAEIKKNAK